jgi:hypothetical protein
MRAISTVMAVDVDFKLRSPSKITFDIDAFESDSRIKTSTN